MFNSMNFHYIIEVRKVGITLEADKFPFEGTSEQAHTEYKSLAIKHKTSASLHFKGRADWVANPNSIARYTS